jgi:hypothetical protein
MMPGLNLFALPIVFAKNIEAKIVNFKPSPPFDEDSLFRRRGFDFCKFCMRAVATRNLRRLSGSKATWD